VTAQEGVQFLLRSSAILDRHREEDEGHPPPTCTLVPKPERVPGTKPLDPRGHLPGRGLPIGSLTSQHFANSYLGGLDRLIKEELRIKGYVRYMDDLALWSEARSCLRSALATVEAYLRAELGLELKPSPYLNRMAHGMDFCPCLCLRSSGLKRSAS
jgi:hypothetical protein